MAKDTVRYHKNSNRNDFFCTLKAAVFSLKKKKRKREKAQTEKTTHTHTHIKISINHPEVRK